jgi:hypothetical protein
LAGAPLLDVVESAPVLLGVVEPELVSTVLEPVLTALESVGLTDEPVVSAVLEPVGLTVDEAADGAVVADTVVVGLVVVADEVLLLPQLAITSVPATANAARW